MLNSSVEEQSEADEKILFQTSLLRFEAVTLKDLSPNALRRVRDREQVSVRGPKCEEWGVLLYTHMLLLLSWHRGPFSHEHTIAPQRLTGLISTASYIPPMLMLSTSGKGLVLQRAVLEAKNLDYRMSSSWVFGGRNHICLRAWSWRRSKGQV